jgi:putative ABC transport system permease protein
MAVYQGVPAKPFMSFAALRYFYRERLRHQAVQELFAGLGIAIAVALLFAVTVASQSVTNSAEAVNRALVGPADLQLRARGQEGLDESLLGRVEALPGVKRAAPLLEEPATVRASGGSSVTVNLAGAPISLAVLDGLVHTLPIATLEKGGMGLSRASTEALGINGIAVQSQGPRVLLFLRGRAVPQRVNAVLGPETVGALSQARVAVMPLERLQGLAGLPHRVSRILVQSSPGQTDRVRSELNALAGGRISVAPTNQDVSLLRQALKPSGQASLFFAAISALLGFLLTFNAFLLTVPQRREAIAEQRLRGVTRSAIIQMVLFQAVCLGVAATALGLLVGYGLSVGVFHQTPNYLAQGFTLGGSTSVGTTPLLVAALGGVLATCLASIVPLLDLRRGRPANAIYLEGGQPGNALGNKTALRLAFAAGALVLVRVIANSALPSLALAWSALLALAAVLCVPLLFSGVLQLGEFTAQRFQSRLTLLPLALQSLGETTLRSLALVATGSAALFGAVALGGARDDLVRGIGGFARHYSSEGDIWVATPNDNQSVTSFIGDDRSRSLARVPGIDGETVLNGGLLDVGKRRIWVLAWPKSSPLRFLDGEVLDGDVPAAAARVHHGGWITLSRQMAAENHVAIGGSFTVPTATGPMRMKVAALTTNFGWSPGSLVMSSTDYRRGWPASGPTAIVLHTRDRTNPEVMRKTIERALGPGNGLSVLTAHGREESMNGTVREGLSQLATISTLLIFASIFAMAAALASAIWQRRSSLAALKLDGVNEARLRKLVLLESALMVSVGAVAGALWGLYGQVALDGYLTSTTGFPVRSLGASWRPLEVLLVVFAASLAVSAIPARLVARVPVRIALEE